MEGHKHSKNSSSDEHERLSGFTMNTGTTVEGEILIKVAERRKKEKKRKERIGRKTKNSRFGSNSENGRHAGTADLARSRENGAVAASFK